MTLLYSNYNRLDRGVHFPVNLVFDFCWWHPSAPGWRFSLVGMDLPASSKQPVTESVLIGEIHQIFFDRRCLFLKSGAIMNTSVAEAYAVPLWSSGLLRTILQPYYLQVA